MSMMFSAQLFTTIFLLNVFIATQLPNGINVHGNAHGKAPSQLGSSLFFPVTGDIIRDGALYTTIHIGNPPKPFKVDIDTVSDLTWVQCAAGPNAKLVKAPNPPYKPNNNAILRKDPLCIFGGQSTNAPCQDPNDQCEYEVQYADHGSSSGVLVRDFFDLKLTNGSVYKPSLAFGCGYDQEFSGSAPYVDGVLGLADSKIGIVSQLHNLAVIKNVISHCFGRQGKGFLFFGDDLLPSGLVWTPMLPNSWNRHLLGPVDLLFGGKTVIAEGINIIFDSGTTYTYVNAQAYQATISLIETGLAGKPLSLVDDGNLPVCWKGKAPLKSIDDVKNYFIPLVVSFTNAKDAAFVIPAESYLQITSHGNVCLGILNGAEVGLGDTNIIGDISLLNKWVVYDNERRMIGWIPYDCNKLPKR